jgi:ABC-type multidrug transport system fused ATPase/permease subunit
VHHPRDVERKFAERLESYRRDAIRSLTSSAWKVPALVLCLATLAGVLIFMMSVQLLQGNLPLPSAISFVICLIAAAFSVRRMHQVRRDIRHVASAAEELNRFLTQVVPQSDDSLLESIDKVRQNTVLEHVTVQDSRSRKLLEDVSVAFNSGQLIGIAADQWLEGRALAELLIGLGRPTSGRMLVDGKLAADLKMDSLTSCAHWVASDGSILTGSIAENLSTANLRFIDPAIELAQLNDLIVRLSEGMNTLVTHDDDRFLADEAFRIGIARALIRQASIVVVEEPEPVHDPSVEQKTLQAVKNLVRPEYLTVVLPKRIGTLRQCDQVVFVHGHRVQDVGSHAELLQRNDVYRHLTYLRFNPYQSGN